MTVSCLIVDDETLARIRLRDLIAEVPWLCCVGEAADGESAVRALDVQRPNLVFLDVELPVFSGLVALERATHRPAVVFTTAFDRYAVTAFELAAIDYLLKPFGRERFAGAVERARRALAQTDKESTLERAQETLASGPPDRIFVRDRGRIFPLALRDVERLQAQDDYVLIHAGGRHHLVHVTLTDLERRLDPARFLRVHRSHVVNTDHVVELVRREDGRMEVAMRDGTRLLASRARSQRLRRL